MEEQAKPETTEKKEPAKDPNTYFVLTHVNKTKSARQYESKSRAQEFFKQARVMGVVSGLYPVKQGKEERDFVTQLQENGITVNVIDESSGIQAGFKKFAGKMMKVLGL